MPTHVVLASSLNLRLAPQRDAGVIDSVPRYTIVKELDASDNARTWLHVSCASRTGWMHNQYLAPATVMDLSWGRRAAGEFGVGEYGGRANNSRVQHYHASLGGRADDHDDADAWCSSFVNWCVEPDYSTRRITRAARSWERWGLEQPTARAGALAVFWRRPGRRENAGQHGWSKERLRREGSYGHVAILLEMLNGQAVVLGGNQSSRQNVDGEVNKTAYALDGDDCGLLTLRWPG